MRSLAAAGVGALWSVLLSCSVPVVAGESPSWHSDQRGQRVAAVAPGATQDVPDNIYSTESIRRTRRASAEDKQALDEIVAAAERWMKIADSEFEAMIPDYSAYPSHGMTSFVCPFCGRSCLSQDPQTPNRMDWAKPYQITRPCCGTVVYEREKDFPKGYAYRPNGSVTVTHLDGKEHTYPFWKGKDRLGRDAIVFTRSEVWRTRRDALRRFAVAKLADAFLNTGHEKYARKLLVILRRFAQVYPALPLWWVPSGTTVDYAWLRAQADRDPKRFAVAVGKDGRDLTRAEFDAWPRPCRHGLPPWKGRNRLGLFNINCCYYAGVDPTVKAFLLVRHAKSMREYSQQVFGQPDRLEAFLRRSQFEEWAKEFAGQRPAMGNFTMWSMVHAGYLGVAARNSYLYNLALELADTVILNHVFADVSFIEGSLPYQSQMSYYHRDVNHMLGDLIQRRDEAFPFTKFAREHMADVLANMATFAGVWSGHGDGNDWRVVPEDAPDKDLRPASRFMPAYGFATLRSGAPGHRTESLLLFDKNTGHTHEGNLNLQLAFEGMLVAPEVGYCPWWSALDVTATNPMAPKLMAIPWRYRLLDLKRPVNWGKIMEYPNVWSLAHSGVLQNTVLVNECSGRRGWGRGDAFADALTLSAPRTPGTVGAVLQVAEARDPQALRVNGVDCSLYRRAVLNVERADGRAYVVDIFRVSGAHRHYYQFKVPRAEVVSTSLRKGRRVGNGWEHLSTKPGVVRHPGFAFLNDVTVHAAPPDAYHVRWLWKPGLKKTDAPGTPPWPNVVLTMHGVRPAADGRSGIDEEVWLSRAHFPIRLDETIGDSRQRGSAAFENGMSVYTKFRASAERLDSRYTHVFEMHTQAQSSTIRRVSSRYLEASRSFHRDTRDRYGVGVVVEFTDGSRDYVVSSPDPEWRALQKVEGRKRVASRFALLRLDKAGRFVSGKLVNGRGFACDDVRVECDGDLTGTIVDIVGDITGTRRESALIIKPYTAWPEGKTLVGERIHVAVAPDHEDLYTVSAVTRQGGNLRVDLEGTPPLGYHWDRIRKIHPDRPSAFRIQSGLMLKPANNFYFRNKRIFFPTLGLDLFVREVPKASHIARTADIVVKPEVDLRKLGCREGTPFVIYGMAVGQAVRIPSWVAVRRDKDTGFAVQTNVDFRLVDGPRTCLVRAADLQGHERVVNPK